MMSKFVYRKQKCIEIAKKSEENKIFMKILRQEKRYGTKRMLAEFPNKHWPVITFYTVIKSCVFWHNMMCSDNSIVALFMGYFVCAMEYVKPYRVYYFADVFL